MDPDKAFFSARTESYPERGSFVLFSEYDVTDKYYNWCNHHNIQRLGTFPPIRCEEEIIDVGVTSHTWESRVHDQTTGALLITWTQKYVSMDNVAKKVRPIDAHLRRLAEDYYARTNRRRSVRRQGLPPRTMADEYMRRYSRRK